MTKPPSQDLSLPDRLRILDEWLEGANPGGDDICNEAADRIEALEAALLEIANAHTRDGQCPGHIDVARCALEGEL